MTSQLNKIADYWNQRSFGYSLDNQEELLHDQEKWIELINRYLKINKGMKVLDLGCGPGFFSVMLTNYGCQVIASSVFTSSLDLLALYCFIIKHTKFPFSGKPTSSHA